MAENGNVIRFNQDGVYTINAWVNGEISGSSDWVAINVGEARNTTEPTYQGDGDSIGASAAFTGPFAEGDHIWITEEHSEGVSNVVMGAAAYIIGPWIPPSCT